MDGWQGKPGDTVTCTDCGGSATFYHQGFGANWYLCSRCNRLSAFTPIGGRAEGTIPANRVVIDGPLRRS